MTASRNLFLCQKRVFFIVIYFKEMQPHPLEIWLDVKILAKQVVPLSWVSSLLPMKLAQEVLDVLIYSLCSGCYSMFTRITNIDKAVLFEPSSMSYKIPPCLSSFISKIRLCSFIFLIFTFSLHKVTLSFFLPSAVFGFFFRFKLLNSFNLLITWMDPKLPEVASLLSRLIKLSVWSLFFRRTSPQAIKAHAMCLSPSVWMMWDVTAKS